MLLSGAAVSFRRSCFAGVVSDTLGHCTRSPWLRHGSNPTANYVADEQNGIVGDGGLSGVPMTYAAAPGESRRVNGYYRLSAIGGGGRAWGAFGRPSPAL